MNRLKWICYLVCISIVLFGCGSSGVSDEEYEALLAERDELKQQIQEQEESNSMVEVSEERADEDNASDDLEKKAIEDTVVDFFEAIKTLKKSDIKPFLNDKNIFAEEKQTVYWTELYVKDVKVYDFLREYMKEELSELKYDIKDTQIIDEKNAVVTVDVSYPDISEIHGIFIDKYLSDKSYYNNLSEEKYYEEIENIYHDILKDNSPKDFSTTFNIKLIKEGDDWIIDNDVVFERQFIQLMTCNSYEMDKNKYFDYDELDKYDEEGNVKDFQEISIGDVIETDFATITIEKAEFGDKRMQMPGSNHYHSAADGNAFYAVYGKIENKTDYTLYIGTNMQGRDIYGEFDIDNSHKYDTSVVAKNDPYSGEIIPMGSDSFALYAEIPENVLNDFSTCDFRFSFNECFVDLSSDDNLYSSKYKYIIHLK